MTAGAYTACRSDRMLPDVWPLHDVPDVEALCRGVIAERTGDHGRRYGLESCDFDEALAFLLGEVVVLERVYDFTRAGIQFRPWLYVRLGWKLIDFWRSFYGRHGEKRVVDTRGFDLTDELDGEHDGLDHPGVAVRGPGWVAVTGAGDVAGDRAFPSEWSESEGDRADDRPVGGLGVAAGRAGSDSGGRERVAEPVSDACRPRRAARARARVAA